MSYCRFGWDDSDLYVFENVNGSLECCACSVEPMNGHWNYTDVAEFLRHLDRHREAGQNVPEGLVGDIVADWKAGEFAEWDDTDPKDMEPFLSVEPVPDPRTYSEFLDQNRHMLGGNADVLVQAVREKEEETE